MNIRWAMLGFGLLGLAVACLYIMLGELRLSPVAAWRALQNASGTEADFIVRELRLPRLVVALLIGMSLAVSGAILQSVIHNPLVAPDVVGITGGAAAGAVLFLTMLSGAASIHFLPAAALLGAFAASALVYWLAWKKGVNSLRLVLVGVGISSLLSALVSFLMVFSKEYTAVSAFLWLTGTIYGTTWEHVYVLLPWTLPLLLVTALSVRYISIQLLGDEMAIGLGSEVQRQRIWLVLLSVALAGSAVAIGGTIGFVGLVAPHMARRLVGPTIHRMLPLAALLGAIMVAAADLVARFAFLPHDIPVGVFTSAIGAPFFIYLLYRSKYRL